MVVDDDGDMSSSLKVADSFVVEVDDVFDDLDDGSDMDVGVLRFQLRRCWRYADGRRCSTIVSEVGGGGSSSSNVVLAFDGDEKLNDSVEDDGFAVGAAFAYVGAVVVAAVVNMVNAS